MLTLGTLTTFVALATAAGPSLEAALQNVAPPHARVTLLAWDPPRECRGDFTPAFVETSGRVPVRVRGSTCEGWGWATVKVQVPTIVVMRDVAANSPLEGAVVFADVELLRGRTPLASLPPGATAAKNLRRGAALTPEDVRVGPPAGTTITVRVTAGSLQVEQVGTVVTCRNGTTGVCATLPSGKRVSGALVDGVLVVGPTAGGTP